MRLTIRQKLRYGWRLAEFGDSDAQCRCLCVEYGWRLAAVMVASLHCNVVLRQCVTLPHALACSTITVPGLSFQVRNGIGRFSWAMTTAKSSILTHSRGFVGCLATGLWTRMCGLVCNCFVCLASLVRGWFFVFESRVCRLFAWLLMLLVLCCLFGR